MRRIPVAFVACLLIAGGTAPGSSRAAYAARSARAATGSFGTGLVDVGGFKLFLTCSGNGSPTVILDSGAGGDSSNWASVQLEVAKVTRVCSYDRAGDGSSNPGPKPRSSQRVVDELHTLLGRAHVSGPYVLAGWSIGGMNMQLYAFTHRPSVVGLVLVDSVYPGMFTPPSQCSRLFATWLAQDNLIGLGAPAGADEASAAYHGGADAVRASQRSLGHMPLAVLTRSTFDVPGLGACWQNAQRNALHLSSNSQFLVVPQSDHFLPPNHPDAVAGAIAKTVSAARKHGALGALNG